MLADKAYDADRKGAHDTVITTIYRVQADGLEIEAAAKRRLADEYDAAQAAGEIEKPGGNRSIIPNQNNAPAKVSETGLTAKEVHDARQFRDAEARDPGITKRTLDKLVEEKREQSDAPLEGFRQ